MSLNTPLYVDVHVLHTVPPSNLNRDDAGTPKQAIYGGVRRARVSSQAWKRATRKAFVSLLPPEQLATRTKRLHALLTDRIIRRAGLGNDEAARITNTIIETIRIKKAKRGAETAYLLFFGLAQLDAIAELVAETASDLASMSDADLKDAIKDLPVSEHLRRRHPIDVALFGRMVADVSALNVDAATQVAHALSTHAVDVEFDYFTAVDDENPREQTGAGMIGTVEFNSATLYRFATVGVHQLVENLDANIDATMQALDAFLTAFVRSMPTGHQNSFAHRTVPHLVMTVVRKDQPVNLVSAFESPVRPDNGLAVESARRLAEELNRATELWALSPLSTGATYDRSVDLNGALETAVGPSKPFPELVSTTVETVRAQLIEASSNE